MITALLLLIFTFGRAEGLLLQKQQCFSSCSRFDQRRGSRPLRLSFTNEVTDDPYSIATLLLGELLQRRTAGSGGAFGMPGPNEAGKQQRQTQRIQDYIQLLSNMPDNTFDPSTSLFGPLYCTLYSFNPSKPKDKPPLWEQISLKSDNLQGQQYFLSRDFEFSVINYAEVWGRGFGVRAKGTFSPAPEGSRKRFMPNGSMDGTFGSRKKTSNLLFVNNFEKSPENALRSCPDVFNVRVSSGEFVLGNTVLPLPIDGGAQLVVLYADPRIRIFLSPTRSDSAVGTWEQSGLVAVQVRSDLVTGKGPLDLR